MEPWLAMSFLRACTERLSFASLHCGVAGFYFIGKPVVYSHHCLIAMCVAGNQNLCGTVPPGLPVYGRYYYTNTYMSLSCTCCDNDTTLVSSSPDRSCNSVALL